jgi:hypothetical protein
VNTERQRDAETDRMLRELLQPGVHAEACPDAGTLAAYAEGVLSPPERDALDVHLADCHGCQEALALMARTWTAADSARPEPAGHWWNVRMRWLVPIAAAAVVVLYVAVRPVIAPTTPAVDQAAQIGPSQIQEQVMADARSQKRELMTAAPDANEAGRIVTPAQSSAGSLDRVKPLPAPESKAKLADQAAPAKVAADVAADRLGATIAPPVEEAPAARAEAAADAPRQQLAMKVSAAPPRDVGSPDGSVIWRLVPGGRVLRSTDRGATWRDQPMGRSGLFSAGSAGAAREWLAGSAPSARVCWIVGRNAAVFITTDGEQWEPRRFPERVDLIGVEATDARTAIVTTRDGRRFGTVDGGATWSVKKD